MTLPHIKYLVIAILLLTLAFGILPLVFLTLWGNFFWAVNAEEIEEAKDFCLDKGGDVIHYSSFLDRPIFPVVECIIDNEKREAICRDNRCYFIQ